MRELGQVDALAPGQAVGRGLDRVDGLLGTILAARAGACPAVLAVPLAVVGAGQGMVAPPVIGTVLARVPAREAGAASGVLLTATQVANALGVAIVAGVFSATAGLGPRDAFTAGAAVALALAVLTGVAAAILRTTTDERTRCEPNPST